jgi:FeS assembly SUF system protein
MADKPSQASSPAPDARGPSAGPPPASPPAVPPSRDPTLSASLFDRDACGATSGPLGAPAADIESAVVEALQMCFDPEIPVNIYDLGLIYGIDVSPENAVTIRMTLTSPACPVAGSLPPEVEQKVRDIPGVSSSKVELVWEPPWGKHLLSEAARLQLGMDGY